MTYRDPKPLSAALERVVARAAPATTLARVQGCWDGVAGGAVAAETEPVAERAGALTVACSSSVWANELELMSADLLARLNEALGGPAITSLRFVAGGRRALR